jgi:hypothetical protein
MAVLLLAVAAVIVAYWAAWGLHRSLVASGTGRPYIQFEEAFPLADGVLALVLVLSAVGLLRRWPATFGLLLAGCGGGFYLLCMDVLYDLEHGVWGRGANGLVEAAINLATLALSAGVLVWTWRRRRLLMAEGHTPVTAR